MKNTNTKSHIYLFVSTCYVFVLLCTALLSVPPFAAFLSDRNYSLGFRIPSPGLSTVIAILIFACYALTLGLLVSKKTNFLWLAYLALAMLYLLEFVEPVLDCLANLIYDQSVMHDASGIFTEKIDFRTLGSIFEVLLALFTYALSASTQLWCALGFLLLSSITRNAVKNSNPPRKKFIFPLLLFILAMLTVTAKACIYLFVFLSEGSYLAEILPYIIAYIATVLIICALIANTVSINKLIPLHQACPQDAEEA